MIRARVLFAGIYHGDAKPTVVLETNKGKPMTLRVEREDLEEWAQFLGKTVTVGLGR